MPVRGEVAFDDVFFFEEPDFFRAIVLLGETVFLVEAVFRGVALRAVR